MTEKIAVLGAGMIGGAVTKILLKNGYQGNLIVTDAVAEKVEEMKELGASATTNNRHAAAEADLLFVCVKPSDVRQLLKEISKEIKGKIVVSTAATLPLTFLKRTVPEAKFVRVMPNLAILVQASYTAYCCEKDVTIKDKEKIEKILSLMGICEEVDEKYMDAITGLSGSGPGYLSIVVEAMMYAGLKLGLPRNIALKAAAQTVVGTGKLMIELNEHPAKIRDMVTTPGGTTIEAIHVLEGSKVRQALMEAIGEAAKKSQLIREKLVDAVT
ncbi:MAG: pyrroline-5-carboxylate reductase [Candidatus Bathyarchaeota archaeon]|nr:pyrroline-5-carboxylate reductase [Candidatus Bathyarchaeota archaeon]